jgi:hypothetical protein
MKHLRYAVMVAIAIGATCGAQRSSAQPEAGLSIAPTNDPYVFTVSLRNVSVHGLSMVLGTRSGMGSGAYEMVEIVRYTLTKSDGEQLEFEDFGLPNGGTVGVLIRNLLPGESYSYNIDVRNTIVQEKDVFFQLLTSGRQLLRIQASADGQKGFDEWKGTSINIEKVAKYPIWKGRASSEPVSLAPQPAPHPHSQP